QTTHAGSLPRSPELIEANAARPVGEDGLTPQRTEEFREGLRQAGVDVVAKQREIGISVPNDGAYGHLMGSAVTYGAWWSYSSDRVRGLAITASDRCSSGPVRSGPGDVRLTTFPDRRDWTRFAAAYQDPTSGITVGSQPTFPAATGPIAY